MFLDAENDDALVAECDRATDAALLERARCEHRRVQIGIAT